MQTKFQVFMRENTPPPVTVSWETVMEVVKELGLEFKMEFDERPGSTCKFFGKKERGCRQSLKVVDQVVLEYQPRWPVFHALEYGLGFSSDCDRGSSSTYGHSFPRDILTALAVAISVPTEVVIRLPEQVVTLPIPPWVEVWGSEGGAQLASIEMFESEARECVKSFMAKLKPFLDDGNS